MWFAIAGVVLLAANISFFFAFKVRKIGMDLSAKICVEDNDEYDR